MSMELISNNILHFNYSLAFSCYGATIVTYWTVPLNPHKN
jgi:hypothetical protein